MTTPELGPAIRKLLPRTNYVVIELFSERITDTISGRELRSITGDTMVPVAKTEMQVVLANAFRSPIN